MLHQSAYRTLWNVERCLWVLLNVSMTTPAICIVFAANVRRIRRAQERSQEQLAEDAGLHRTYVSALERGNKSNPSIIVADKLAKALGVPIGELFEPN